MGISALNDSFLSQKTILLQPSTIHVLNGFYGLILCQDMTTLYILDFKIEFILCYDVMCGVVLQRKM